MRVERTASWALAVLGVVALGGLLSMHGLEAGASLRPPIEQHGDHTHEADCVGCDHLGHVAGVCVAVIVAAVALRRASTPRFVRTWLAAGSNTLTVVRERARRPRGVPPPRLSNCVWVC